MNQSSLPEIFKKSQTLPVRASKQGPSFSLHLNTSSPQKYSASKAGYAPGQNNFASLQASKSRAMSMQQVQSKQSVLKEFNSRRTIDNRTKIKVSFRQDFDLPNSAPLKQKLGMPASNWTNFPYETSRRFNNNTIDLQETQNLKNKMDSLNKEMHILQGEMHTVKQLKTQTKNGLAQLRDNIEEDMGNFELTFQNLLKNCYNNLSLLRRETNDQVKSNKTAMDKLKGDMSVCSNFTNDLKQKATEMFKNYVQTLEEQDVDVFKGQQLNFDFEEISSIKKSSRGATGDMSRRTRRNDLIKNIDTVRKSEDLKMMVERQNKFVLNGKEIELLNFQDQY